MLLHKFDIEKRIKCINILKEFYGQPQQSTFNNETNVSNAVIDKTQLNDGITRSFFTNFHVEVKREGQLRNSKIRKLILSSYDKQCCKEKL